MKAHLLLAAIFCCTAFALRGEVYGPPAPTEPPAEKPVEEPREAAKREAWTSAVLIVSLLEQGDNTAFPGISAWLADFRRIAGNTPPPVPGKPFPPLDPDALVTRNPNFWSAFFEVQPGDPGFALLHSALLLAGGEAQRAMALAAFGLQRAGVSEEIKRGLNSLMAHCVSAQAGSTELVREGVRLHDRRDFAGALRCFDAALILWPANGSAHYERGSTLRMKAIAATPRPPGGTAPEPAGDPPEVVECFARARRHDPLHLLAYQGDNPATLEGLMALVQSGLPVWEAIRKQPEQQQKIARLIAFSEACQTAGIDDFALVLRQIVVSLNKRYSTTDRDLIAASLPRLAPTALTPALLARINGEPGMPVRQIVVPVTVDPSEIAQAKPEEPSPSDVKKKEPAAKPMAKGKSSKASTSASAKKITKPKGSTSKTPTKSKPKGKKGKK